MPFHLDGRLDLVDEACLRSRLLARKARGRRGAAYLRQFRTALSIIDIRQASVLSGRARKAINAFLAHLAAICSNHAAGPLPGGLVGQLDGTIAFTLQESAGETRDAALVGLGGVRSPIVTAAVDKSIAPA